jgi:cardiolipin synthase (CMP-forming)
VTNDPWLTVPNVISFARLALVPVFLWFRLTGEPEVAFTVFIVAAASDLLDGFLARLLDQRSKLGGIIDPTADKALIFTALVTLVVEGLLPLWLLLLEAFRDSAMAIGAVMVKRRQMEIPTTPSRIGKYSTFALVITVVLALASASPRAPQALPGYVVATAFVSALCVVVSTLQYWMRFGYLIIAPERARKAPSVDDQRRTHA